MKVIITPAAEGDLLAIALWIAEDNPARAVTFLDELRNACEALGHAPQAYPLVERYKSLGVRKRVYRDYLIFYRIIAGRIDVVHVLHGSRDYEELLSQEFE